MFALLNQLLQDVDLRLQLSQIDLICSLPTPEPISWCPAESARLIAFEHVDEGGHIIVNTLPHCLRIDYPHFCGLCDEAQVAHGQLRIGRVHVKGVDLLHWWLVGDDSNVGVLALQKSNSGPLELHAQAHFIYALFYSKNYYFSPSLAPQPHPHSHPVRTAPKRPVPSVFVVANLSGRR